MDIETSKNSILINENCLKSTYEQPFELDCILPDYCMDIENILCTNIFSAIENYSVVDKKLCIDGNVKINIQYIGKENNPEKYECKTAFSKIIELKSAYVNPQININCFEGYINCRAVSPRRLDIRGTVLLDVDICENKTLDYIDNINYENLQFKKDNIGYLQNTANFSKQFSIKESINLDGKEHIPEKIMMYNIIPFITEYKLLPGKIIIKGELKIHILYCCQHNNIHTFDKKIPFSQILDCAEIEENGLCDIKIKLLNAEIECINNIDTNNIAFDLYANLMVNCSYYKEFSNNFISDCYCTKYNCNVNCEKTNLLKFYKNIDEVFCQSESIELKDNTIEIIDCYSKLISYKCCKNEDKICFDIKIIACILAKTDITTYCIQKPITLNTEIKLDKNMADYKFYPTINIENEKTSDINNNKTLYNFDLVITGKIFEIVNCNILNMINIDEKSEKSNAKDKIIIYYPHNKMSLWDIAKKFNTSVDSLKELNNLTDDYVNVMDLIIITPN